MIDKAEALNSIREIDKRIEALQSERDKILKDMPKSRWSFIPLLIVPSLLAGIIWLSRNNLDDRGIFDVNDARHWETYYQLWKCDDGTFEVRAPSGSLRFKVDTEEEARERRHSLAVEMAKPVPEIQYPPWCGKRIE